MNHDDDSSRRRPARELMPYDGLKRTWNDDSTTTVSTGRSVSGSGGGGGRSNKRRRGILAQFESISVHDDDNDDDYDDYHPDVSFLQDDNAMDNIGDVTVAGSRDRYSSSRAHVDVDEYRYHATRDDGMDRFSCDDDDDDDQDQDDDEELLSDEELFKRRLEKQVYVNTGSIDRLFVRLLVAKDMPSHVSSTNTKCRRTSFHKLALGTTSSRGDTAGAIDAAASCDPVERKFAQIVYQCMKEAAATAAARDNDSSSNTSGGDSSSSKNTIGGRLGAFAAVDDPFSSFCRDDAAAAASVWSLEAMDLD
jgi:hypothetical protein